MGNTSSQGSAESNATKKLDNDPKQMTHICSEILRELSLLCTDDQFPLRIFRQGPDASSHNQLISLVLCTNRSEEFSTAIIKLIWNSRTSIPRDETAKLFHDCCMFDLKQALAENISTFQDSMLDSTCFTALANSIGTLKASEIEQEQFQRWMRQQFPTLFYIFEMWFRKSSKRTEDIHASLTASTSNRSLMSMNNILNPTWIWLLTHNIPALYLAADNTCINLLDRLSSVWHDRMWDHLYDSHRDGASLNRFQHHTFGYKAPIIILFEISDGYLFCLCCDEEFRESAKQYGGIQTCLFQLRPTFKLVLEGPNIIFMNTRLRALSALGLLVGRDFAHTFLKIDEDFFNVKHLNGEGRLTAIDVWGVGGSKSVDEQNRMRAWENKQVEKANKIKRSYEEEEAILNMAGVVTRHPQEQL